MGANKILISGLVSGIAVFLLGYLFYGVIFMNTMEGMTGSATGVMREMDAMVWWALIVGNLLWGFLLAYIFGMWAGIFTFMGGLKGGAIIGLLATGAFDLTMYATSNITTLGGSILDIVIFTVIMGIAGGVAGWMLGRGK
ncbi:MAG: hypothetical protein R2806_20375 [Saprospiraceae bacterium]